MLVPGYKEGGRAMSIDQKVLEDVLVRSMGLLGKEKAEEVAKRSGINLLVSGAIELSEPPDKALENLIRNVVAEGGIIAKIAVKNMSRQYNFPMPQGI